MIASASSLTFAAISFILIKEIETKKRLKGMSLINKRKEL